MKLLRTVCVIGIALCLATSVYAGTQSVKISGDLDIRGFARGAWDLQNNHQEPDFPRSDPGDVLTNDPYPGTDDWMSWFMTTTEVQIDADLTDNVSGVIRLFNQRDWNSAMWNTQQKQVNTTNASLVRGEGITYTQRPGEFDVGLDLAYIELKEFMYSPLTLRIGRQDIWFGKGFVVGYNLRDYNANIFADEYTCMTSFDAIRATLDYDPWTIDAIASMIWENEVGSKDNEQLYGVNVGYIFDVFNAEAEGYWFFKNDNQIQPTLIQTHNTVQTFGLRGSADPIENWTASVEGAIQFGQFVGFRAQQSERDRFGYAIDAAVECRYFKDMFPWKPVIGAEYILYSGDENERPDVTTDGWFHGWDPMYRGKFDTAYREFVGKYNYTGLGWKGRDVTYVNTFPDASYTNQHQVLISAGIMPMDSLTLDGKLAFFWQYHQREIPNNVIGGGAGNSKRRSFIGTELDVNLVWDYTEDVSFGLLAGWFFPGGFYSDQSDSIATDVVGSVKLSF